MLSEGNKAGHASSLPTAERRKSTTCAEIVIVLLEAGWQEFFCILAVQQVSAGGRQCARATTHSCRCGVLLTNGGTTTLFVSVVPTDDRGRTGPTSSFTLRNNREQSYKVRYLDTLKCNKLRDHLLKACHCPEREFVCDSIETIAREASNTSCPFFFRVWPSGPQLPRPPSGPTRATCRVTC